MLKQCSDFEKDFDFFQRWLLFGKTKIRKFIGLRKFMLNREITETWKYVNLYQTQNYGSAEIH